MNVLDIIVVAVVAISGLFAFVRGFARELLSIAAWVGAFVVTFYLFDPARTIARGFMKPWLADVVAPAAVFVVCLIIFSIVTGVLSNQVRQSSLGAIDRALGMIFGVARGVLVACAAYLVMTRFLAPEDRPNWVVQAHTQPLLEAGAQRLNALIPRNVLDRGTQAASEAAQKVNQANQVKQDLDKLNAPMGANKAPPAGPSQQDETDLTHLVDKALQTGSKP
ncbi:colicin V biosynthesis protein [Aliidongia dinghuensis]|uniref:Colicin V biosynthesis protein n=1 Tax=Aliidongia dinghuensis TaxID=1867774 RepID=A0A8J2YVM5_9PROT|nr:CvpA family protein [Aliidongia dinghuensis]GGF25050.1 colicin V biosynthesis protein [Aliidongia dinghuensis]